MSYDYFCSVDFSLKFKHRLISILFLIQTVTSFCSQVGDTRPVASCRFSPNSKLMATAGWSGSCKLWSVPDCEEVITYQGKINKLKLLLYKESLLKIATHCSDGSQFTWQLLSIMPSQILKLLTTRHFHSNL